LEQVGKPAPTQDTGNVASNNHLARLLAFFGEKRFTGRMKLGDVNGILFVNLILCVALTMAATVWTPAHALGVGVGAAIGALNLWLLAVMLRKLLLAPEERRGLVLRFLAKYGLVGLLIAVAFFLLKVSPVGFAAGITTTVVALIFGGLFGRRES